MDPKGLILVNVKILSVLLEVEDLSVISGLIGGE